MAAPATSLTPRPAAAPNAGNERTGTLALARMEIGGLRFALPLSEVAAVIEPTAMEPDKDDPYAVWIGHVQSSQGIIRVASGSALIKADEDRIPPSRIAILRGERPVGLAVDRMLSAGTVERDQILSLPSIVPAIQSCPVVAAHWDEDETLELLLDRDDLIAELDSGLNGVPRHQDARRSSLQRLLQQYTYVDYSRGLEVRFGASEDRWVLPMAAVRLVTRSRTPHPLPRTPRKVAGLVSWNRQPIPVIDPSFQINLSRRISTPAFYVVVGAPAGVGETSTEADAAILVDGVVGIHNDLRVENSVALDATGGQMNCIRLSDVLS